MYCGTLLLCSDSYDEPAMRLPSKTSSVTEELHWKIKAINSFTKIGWNRVCLQSFPMRSSLYNGAKDLHLISRRVSER